MKKIKSIILFLVGAFAALNVSSQANAYINILTQNSGQVGQGSAVNIEVSVGNTGPNAIAASKVKTVVTVPIALVNISPNAEQTGLPAGWTILSNNAATGVITLCNGTDVIPANDQRTILIKVQGNNLGGPSTIIGQLNFSGGVNCASPGSLPGDNSADNNSTTSIEVINIVPLTLIDFKAGLENCEPFLSWVTESEMNTDRFEIERSSRNSNGWTLIGTTTAIGPNSTKNRYRFIDKNHSSSSENVLYRLKIIDKNGEYKYSKILTLVVNCKTARLSVYPNPVQNGKLYVTVNGITGYAEATLMSVSGQVILKSKVAEGTSCINISSVAEGIYVLNIIDANGFNRNIKVSVMH